MSRWNKGDHPSTKGELRSREKRRRKKAARDEAHRRRVAQAEVTREVNKKRERAIHRIPLRQRAELVIYCPPEDLDPVELRNRVVGRVLRHLNDCDDGRSFLDNVTADFRDVVRTEVGDMWMQDLKRRYPNLHRHHGTVVRNRWAELVRRDAAPSAYISWGVVQESG